MDYKKLISTHPELFSNKYDLLRIITDPEVIEKWQERRRLQLMQTCNPIEWANIGIVLEDPYFVIIRDLVEFPGGNINGYIRLYSHSYLESNTPFVVILPEKNGEILLIHQFRHATRMFHWEIPRGFGESGVDSKTQAINELKEEIEGDVANIINLGTMFHNTALDGNPATIFLAHMVSIGKMQIEEGIQRSKWFNISEIEQMISNEEITDGFTIAAYTRAKLKGLI